MKKSFFFGIILAFFCLFNSISPLVFSQSVQLQKWWEKQADAKVHFYNNDDFWGILLDGRKFSFPNQQLVFVKLEYLTHFSVDSSAFEVDTDTSIVWEFEKLLKDTIERNAELLSFPPKMKLCHYIRQYIKFTYNHKDYLLVTFTQLDSIEQMYERKLDKMNSLIYSRNLVSYHYRWSLYDYQFVVLYEIGSREMQFVYIETKSNFKNQ